MIELFNDKWQVKISQCSYDPDSADNIVKPDNYIKLCDDYSKELLLDIFDNFHAIEKTIVLKVSHHTPHYDFAFIIGDELFLFLNDLACVLDLNTADVVRKANIGTLGVLFAAYRYQDDFILYGEMEIMRIAQDLNVKWTFSGKDIFVRYQGEEPAFEMCEDRIRLYDFLDNFYEVDYDGNL